jgi:hypothetical protein
MSAAQVKAEVEARGGDGRAPPGWRIRGDVPLAFKRRREQY